jgi:hypothetical protein
MPTPEIERSKAGLVPLSEQQREAYPTIIYQETSNTLDPQTPLILVATLQAVNEAGHELVADQNFDMSTGAQTVMIRTAAIERGEHMTESALVYGTTRAIGLELEEVEGTNPNSVNIAGFANEAAEALVGQITGSRDLYKAFESYYGGVRLSSDQQKFAAALVAESAVYDRQAIADNLRGQDMVNLIHNLELEIPYNQYKDWYEKDSETIFKETPELDYRRLDDETFRATPEGQLLEEGYRKILGYKLADQYTRYPRAITDEGIIIERPIIPLAQFPVVEALIADQVSTTKPRYYFGASAIDELIVESNSTIAQKALVESITTRLPKQDPRAFDEPSEFIHKRKGVTSLLRGYLDAYGDYIRQSQFKDYLITILKAYSNNGNVVSDVRRDWQEQVAKSRDWVSPREVNGLKNIVQDIMTIGLASSDAEEFIAVYMPEFEKGLTVEVDPIALNANDQKSMLFDALKEVSTYSDPSVFERLGTRIFQDSSIGKILKEVAELRIEASQMLDNPQVRLARRELGRCMIDSPKQDEVRKKLDQLTAPSTELRNQAHNKLNQLFINYLNSMVDSDQLTNSRSDADRLFENFVKRIYIGDTLDMEQLPEIYEDLMSLAERPDLPDRNKSTILWHFAEKFKYASKKSGKFLTPVILDAYRIMLGSIGELRLPTPDTNHGLAAATFLARETGLLKYANEDQLLILSRHKGELASLIQRVNAGMLAPETTAAESEEDEEFEEWQEQQMKNLADVARSMVQLENLYTEYLHLEEVKIKPNVYYPWLMKHLNPFWRKMQGEVGPGNSPQPNIINLHAALQEHISSLLVLRDGDCPEDFHAVDEGHIDSFLLECFERMSLDHEIHNNPTVWREGLSFLHYATAMMPPVLIEQIREAHPDDQRYDRFLEYVESEQERWQERS